MVIKVLGAGCQNCKKVKTMALEVIRELAVDAVVEEVTDIQDIMSYGVINTPGIVIDEKLIGSGGVPSKEQMYQVIRQAVNA